MVLSSVGPDHEKATHILDFINGISHCSAAERGHQTGDRGGVSETGAVVDIVGTNHHPSKLLHEVIFLIGALSGREKSNAVRTLLILDLRES